MPTVDPANPVPGIADFMESMRVANAYSHNVFIRDSGVPDPTTLLTVREIVPPRRSDRRRTGRGGHARAVAGGGPEDLGSGYSPSPDGDTRIFTAVSLRLIKVSNPSSTRLSRPIFPVMNGLRSIFPDSTSSMVAGWEFT